MLIHPKRAVRFALRAAGYDIVKLPRGSEGDGPDGTSETEQGFAEEQTSLPASAPPVLLEIAPLEEIPYPRIDLGRGNPLPCIVAGPEFALTCDYLQRSPSRSRALISVVSQALLYTLIRNMCPAHIVEIGSLYAGTSEAMCRALHANGRGMLHTIDPYGKERVPGIIAQWPEELQRHATFYDLNSMAFFEHIGQTTVRPDLIFIDGNHDYEFALFDMQCAARTLQPGGFIVADDVSQSGPYFAAQDFLAAHSDWIECGLTTRRPDETKAFDLSRSRIPETDFAVLRAPTTYSVGSRPFCCGMIRWHSNSVNGLRLSLAVRPSAGTLDVQLVLRGFSDQRQAEEVISAKYELTEDGTDNVEVAANYALPEDFDSYTVEPWLIWRGPAALVLSSLPSLF